MDLLNWLLMFALLVSGSGDVSFSPDPAKRWEVTVLGSTDAHGQQYPATVYATDSRGTWVIGACGGQVYQLSGQFSRCFTSLRYDYAGDVTITVSDRGPTPVDRVIEVRLYDRPQTKIFLPMVGRD